MPELIGFALAVAAIAVVGVRFGMLLASRIDRRISVTDAEPLPDQERTG